MTALPGSLSPASGERVRVRGPSDQSILEDSPLTPALSPAAGENE
jgi:hypothetical protein